MAERQAKKPETVQIPANITAKLNQELKPREMNKIPDQENLTHNLRNLEVPPEVYNAARTPEGEQNLIRQLEEENPGYEFSLDTAFSSKIIEKSESDKYLVHIKAKPKLDNAEPKALKEGITRFAKASQGWPAVVIPASAATYKALLNEFSGNPTSLRKDIEKHLKEQYPDYITSVQPIKEMDFKTNEPNYFIRISSREKVE